MGSSALKSPFLEGFKKRVLQRRRDKRVERSRTPIVSAKNRFCCARRHRSFLVKLERFRHQSFASRGGFRVPFSALYMRAYAHAIIRERETGWQLRARAPLSPYAPNFLVRRCILYLGQDCVRLCWFRFLLGCISSRFSELSYLRRRAAYTRARLIRSRGLVLSFSPDYKRLIVPSCTRNYSFMRAIFSLTANLASFILRGQKLKKDVKK
jgi:hypothetical protein